MVISNGYLMIFALAMMGCVLATPLVTQLAAWVGAIDRPDQFRRIHHGAIPRLGGLGLALGIAAGIVLPHFSGSSRLISLSLPDLHHEWAILSRRADHPGRGLRRRHPVDRPARQAAGPGARGPVLYLGGIRIQTIEVLEPEPRPGPAQPAVQRAADTPSTWRCPAWRSRCSGSWAA